MRVVFVRHGQPDFDTRRWVGVREAPRLLQQYRDARVTRAAEEKIATQKAGVIPHIMASGLVRAQDSVKLCLSSEFEVSELLNEADLPHPKRLIVPLPWSILLVVCRVGWLLGYWTNVPGMRHDVERAKFAAELLIERAREHSEVSVFGHGIMNRLIVRELRKRGWSVQSETGRGYWSRITVADVASSASA